MSLPKTYARAGFSLIFQAALILLFTRPLFGDTLDPETLNWPALRVGEVMVQEVENKDNVPGIRAMFVVETSKENIWHVLTDYSRFPEIFKGTKSAKIKKQGANWADVEIVFKKKSLGFINLKYKYVLHRKYHPALEMLTWERVSGDFRVIEGFWKIYATGKPGSHLLVYESYLDGQWFFPASLVRSAAVREATAMAEHVRQWMERPHR